MSDINWATLTGRVAQKPSIYDTDNGKIVRFNLATTEQYKSGEEFKERVTYNSVAVYDKFKAEAAAKFEQGDRVLLQGSVQTHSYNKNGETKYTTEIALRPGDRLMLLTKVKPKTEPKTEPKSSESAAEAIGKRPVQSEKPQPK
jgi:single-strand DNA-binding protein